MANPIIKIKRSAVAGKIPTTTSLELGELAINTYDGKVYIEQDQGAVGVGTTIIIINPWSVGLGSTAYNTYFTAGSVGIGTTNPTEPGLSVLGKVQIHQDSSSNNRIIFRGQPGSSYRWNIDNYSSSNQFRIFREDDATSANGSVAVSISTTGTVTATKFSGDGSLLTGITASGSGVVIKDDGSTVGTATTIDFGSNLSASFSSGTATISLSNNASISGILTADQVYTSNNGNGTNIRIGDDAWLGDINVANTTRISGAQDGTKGFIVFGNSDAVALGRTGTGPLYYGGNFEVAGVITASSFNGNASSATYATSAGIATYATTAGVSTSVIGGISSVTRLQVTGISTFSSGPVFIGAATSTGTASQTLQVTGGAYVSGSVGIGITNPTQKLTVSNNILLGSSVSGQTATPAYLDLGNNYSNGTTKDKCKLYLYNSGSAQYGFSVGSNSDIQYHSNVNGVHDFYINNSKIVGINSFGIGIGGATPTVNSPLYVLGTSNTFVEIDSSSSNAPNGIAVNDLSSTKWIIANRPANNNNLYFSASPADRNGTTIAAAAKLTITQSGRIGIGTTNPTYALDFGTGNDSTIRVATANSGTALRVHGTSNNFDINLLRVSGGALSNDSSDYGFSVKYMGTRNLNNNSLSIFSDNQAAASQIEVITIQQDGSVGIASTNPTSLLDVVGNAKFTGIVTASSFSGNATSATYASTAGIATYAISAGIATYATNAGVSTYATSAGIATYADTAGIATNATYASTAGIATYSTSAGIASALTATASVNTTGIITASQLSTGASGTGINITTNTLSGPAEITIDPSAVGDNTGAVRIKGDLYVDGTQTFINSTTIELADFNVGIATTIGTNSLLDGAGIGIGSTGIRKTLTWDNANTALKSSENFNLATGKVYEIDGTTVLSSNTLGSGVVNSSLTSVGTLTNLSVGDVNSTGIITASNGFVGNLTGTATYATSAGIATNVKGTGSRVLYNSATDTTTTSSNLTFDGTTLAVNSTPGANTSSVFLSGTPFGSNTKNGLLGVGTLGFTDNNIIANFATDVNSYAQVILQNLNSGNAASADFIVNSDSPLGQTYYGDFGINGTAYNGGGPFGDTSGTYLYAKGGTLALGTDDAQDVRIATGSAVATPVTRVTITGIGGSVGIGTTNPTQTLHVQGNARITGGIYDSNNNVGTAGSVLSSTGTGLSWIPAASGGGGGSTTKTTSRSVATAAQTSFSVNYTVGYIDVYLNGSKLDSTEYTASDGTTVVLTESASANDVLEFVTFSNIALSSGTTIIDDTTTNADRYLTYTDATSGGISTLRVASTELTFNPGTNTFTTGNIVGTALNISGVSTLGISIPSQIRLQNVAEKLTRINGNTVSIVYTSGAGNIGLCTNPTGDITLAVTGIPTDSSFDNHSILFSVIVNQTGTARSCTAVTLNGVSRTIKWSGGSLASAISGVTTTSGYDIYNFTGINTIGSASTATNYEVLGVVNGGFR